MALLESTNTILSQLTDDERRNFESLFARVPPEAEEKYARQIAAALGGADEVAIKTGKDGAAFELSRAATTIQQGFEIVDFTVKAPKVSFLGHRRRGKPSEKPDVQHVDTPIAPATMAKLAAHPNVVALKDSSGSISYFNKVRVAVEPFADKFAVFMGPDAAVGEAVLMGADGGVCTGANLWPRLFKELHLAAKAGDLARVRALQRFTTAANMRLYAVGSGHASIIQGVKAALSEMGLVRNVLATPFEPFSGEKLDAIRTAVAQLKTEAAKNA